MLVSVGASYDGVDGRPHPHVAGRRGAPRHARRAGRCTCPATPDEVRAAAAGGRRHDEPVYLRLSTRRNNAAPQAGRAPADGACRAGRAGRAASWSRSGRCSTRCWRRPPGWTSPSRTPTRRGRSTPPGCGRSSGTDVVLVEPYLAGTSARFVAEALAARAASAAAPRAWGATDLRRYGSPRDHARWHGLDAAGAAPVDQRVSALSGRAGGPLRARSRPRMNSASTPSFQVIFLPSSRPRAR